MTIEQTQTAADRRRSWLREIRTAVAIAEKLAKKMSVVPDIDLEAQALLQRLSTIRAEVDLIELLLLPQRAHPPLRRPEEDPRRPHCQS